MNIMDEKNLFRALSEVSKNARELRAGIQAHSYLWHTFQAINRSAPGSVDPPEPYSETSNLAFNDIPIKLDKTLPGGELRAMQKALYP